MVDERCDSIDAIITDDHFKLPDSIYKYLGSTEVREVRFEGQKPYNAEGLVGIFDSRKSFRLSGYFSRIDSLKHPPILVFFVEQWEPIRQ
jgi:hypothetical protein